jgi:hypothetical protein
MVADETKMGPKRFEISGRVFHVRKPVMGQLELVSGVLTRLARRAGEGEAPDTGAMLAAMGEELYFFLAVVLVEEGCSGAVALAARDLGQLAAWLEWEAEDVPSGEIITAFFGWPGLADMIRARSEARNQLLGYAGLTWRAGRPSRPTSSGPSSSSPGVTSSGETPSGGATT